MPDKKNCIPYTVWIPKPIHKKMRKIKGNTGIEYQHMIIKGLKFIIKEKIIK